LCEANQIRQDPILNFLANPWTIEKVFNNSKDNLKEKKAWSSNSNAHNVVRCSTAKGFLNPTRGRVNLTVLTKAQTTRILLENKKAIGIEYLKLG
jgi:choline dehydrogenase-like flavoprotein